MRQIKFRAWVEEIKYMNYTFDAIAWSGLKWSKEYPMLCDFSYDEDEFQNAILMQYTGLKDKNGKEIYEGDILSFIEVDEDSAFGREEKLLGKIEWINDCAQFRCVYPSGLRRELYTIVGADYIYDVQVIGNIYENPELLQDPISSNES